ncbi:hypothetical protein M422DRAFT_260584 [Sphaerobolus stellatus SS14]|uniref:Uncharacterized protein n=1 Tax=Sphaerobolus stellatus (strain SS14) TaxID=990650 RepID=A0A0C9V5X6_SPHS4|nr:hypothetical protein M422DRAFT_260584 [Sphaerobolus stellatus SS14]
MTDTPFPAHILAWKVSSDVIRMEEIPVGDPVRIVQGFAPDKEFNVPAPKLVFDDPYEDDEDRLNKVNKYWKACDKERMQREACYKKLLGAEVEATKQRKADEIVWAEKAKEEAAVREKEKGLEKDKAVKLVGEKEMGSSGINKGKAREVPKTPRKVTPKKSQTEIWSESEEDEDEDKLQSCIYCMKKTITCVPQTGKKVCIACGKRKMKCEFFDKTTWAVMDGSKQVVDAMRESVGLGRCQEAGRLEVIWHDHQRFMMEVESRATADLSAFNTRLLQLLELKSKGVEIPEDLEARICMEREVIQRTLTEQLEDLTVRMDSIQKCMAWTKNGLPRLTPEVPPSVVQGTKRKGDNEGDRAEESKKKKKKKVVETEEESTMRIEKFV